MKRLFKGAAIGATLMLVAGVTPVAAQDVSFELWTKEGEADGSLQWVQKLADDYMAANPDVAIEVIQKEVGGSESLRQDFQIQSFAGNPPALLWTVADHVGPFTAAEIVLQTDDLFDNSQFVDGGVSAMQTPDGRTWGVPINVGNHLMLYYNQDLVAGCPADSDALIAAASEHADTENGKFGIVYRQDESYWLFPIYGGFGGSVFAEDGVTPTLNNEAMVMALKWMNDLEFVHNLMPVEADYQIADDLFKQGNAAFTINGDWTLGAYADLDFPIGVCAIPPFAGGENAKPFTAGNFFMISNSVTDDPALQDAVLDFVEFATSTENQLLQLETLKRLPSRLDALGAPSIVEDPLLQGSAAALQSGIPQPSVLEMRCVFDALNSAVRANAASADADQAQLAADAQSFVESQIAPGGECAPE